MSALNKFDSFSNYTQFAPRFSYANEQRQFSVSAKKHTDSHLNFTFWSGPSSTPHQSKLYPARSINWNFDCAKTPGL
jgi:hypothetical protein